MSPEAARSLAGEGFPLAAGSSGMRFPSGRALRRERAVLERFRVDGVDGVDAVDVSRAEDAARVSARPVKRGEAVGHGSRL